MAGALLVGGAVGLALANDIIGGGTNLSIRNNIFNDMVVKVAIESSTSCITQIQGTQQFSVVSNNSTYPGLTGADSSCSLCYSVLSKVLSERKRLENNLQALGYPYQTLNPDFSRDFATGSSDFDPCALMCFDIVVEDVEQIASYQSTLGCSVTQTMNTDIQNAFNANVNSHLTNQQDIFGKVLGGLTRFNSSMSTNLSNIMASTVSTKLLQNIQLQTQNLQSFSIGNNGGNTHSVYVRNAKQAFTINQIGQLKVVNNVMDQLRQSAQYSILQDLLNKNDTLGTISDTFVNFFTIWSKFIKETMGQLFIIFLMVLIMFIFYKSYQYTTTSLAMQKRHELVDEQVEKSRETKNQV
jgi:hypothetical protein